MKVLPLNSQQKALKLNLDDSIYGTFSEIGAGQEVARNFFQAGGAAGTMAKTMSAYDMIISDTIYGKEKSGRYVCEERVATMVSREYELLTERLKGKRSSKTKFFSFADTVAAKSFRGNKDCHGWLGVRFQHEADSQPSQLIIHIKMLDRENVQQQEAIGVLGVNMIYACYFALDNGEDFVESLMDNLTKDRIQMDMIRVEGPAFDHMDGRLLSLELVKKNFCKMILFDEKGDVLQASDALYKKNLCVLRGSWRPPTLVNFDMLNNGFQRFQEDLSEEEKKELIVLPEISMHKLIEKGEISSADFLARVDLICGLGPCGLISKSVTIASLSTDLSSYSRRKIGFVLGSLNLEEIFQEEKYKGSHGGILGGLGDLIGGQTTIYVYPSHKENGELDKISSTISLNPKFKLLLEYLIQNGFIQDIRNYTSGICHIWSRKVLSMIDEGNSEWESMVPSQVAKKIKEKKLFGFKE